MAKKTKSKKAETPEKKKRLNPYTEEKNNQPPVKVEEAKIVGEETKLPETMSIVPIREFAMPIAKPEQLQKAMELYQECVNALIKSSDIVLIEGKPHGKKIAVNKINRVFGVSTEVIRSFQEEHIAYKDYWSKGYNKVILVRKGEKYMVAKAWVRAILPNGQFCTRGAAVSETERRFAHTPHDLIATAETRAMKNAAINLLGVEFELMEEEEEKTINHPPQEVKSKEIPIVEDLAAYLKEASIANKEKAILAPSGDPLEWPEELVKKLEDKVPVIYRRKDDQIDYYTFYKMTAEQEKYFDWFKANTNFKVPDKRKMSKDRARMWLHWAFKFANRKGIEVPQEIVKKKEIPVRESPTEQDEPDKEIG